MLIVFLLSPIDVCGALLAFVRVGGVEFAIVRQYLDRRDRQDKGVG
jgi:hypothetical protein